MSDQHDWPERYLKRLERMPRAEFMKLYQQEWPITERGYREFMGFEITADPSLPDDTMIVQTGKETAVFKRGMKIRSKIDWP